MDEIIRHLMKLYSIDEVEAKRRVERVLQEESIKRRIYDAAHWFDTWGEDDSYDKEYAHLRKPEENRIPQPKEIAEKTRAMLGKKGESLRTFDDFMKELGAIPEVERQAIKEKARLVCEIIDRREQLGWTQAQLAERAGLKQSAIVRLENAPTIPRIDTIQKVAIALGLSIKMLTKDDTAL